LLTREATPVNNPNIYNVERNNRLSPELQPLTPDIGNYFVVFCKKIIQVINTLE
jgi:hypothetical protein